MQSASYVLEHGQLDLVVDPAQPLPPSLAAEGQNHVLTPQQRIETLVCVVVSMLCRTRSPASGKSLSLTDSHTWDPLLCEPSDADKLQPFDYTKSRKILRPQVGSSIDFVKPVM